MSESTAPNNRSAPPLLRPVAGFFEVRQPTRPAIQAGCGPRKIQQGRGRGREGPSRDAAGGAKNTARRARPGADDQGGPAAPRVRRLAVAGAAVDKPFGPTGSYRLRGRWVVVSPQCGRQSGGFPPLRRPLCSSVANGGRHRWNLIPGTPRLPQREPSGNTPVRACQARVGGGPARAVPVRKMPAQMGNTVFRSGHTPLQDGRHT